MVLCPLLSLLSPLSLLVVCIATLQGSPALPGTKTIPLF